MKKIYLLIIAVICFSFKIYDSNYYALSGGSFTQDWTTTTLITTNDSWTGVSSIQGFLGQDITTATGTDPQTLLTTSSVANDVDVIANQTNPNTNSSGGVAEFDGITNPTIALQGSGTADAPNVIVYLNTTGRANVRVQYNLRDIDGSTDNAVQPVALQYRVGSSGNFTNLAAGFVADATTGPSLATLVTAVDVTLPVACENQGQVELRIITTNAAGNDEWVGIDDINISSTTSAVVTPSLTVNPTTLSFPATPINTTSATLSYTITGTNLTAPVIIAIAAPYSVCETVGGTYVTSLNIPAADVIAPKTIYVKYSPTAAGTQTGSVTNNSTGASQATVSLSGTSIGLINLTSSPYVQNFDGLATGLPLGITVKTAATASVVGTDAAFTTTPTSWNSTTAGFKNYASGNNDEGASASAQAGFTDRAIGVRQTGALGDPGAAFVFQVANSTGKINFTMDFNLQSLDVTSPRVTTWRVDYGFGVNPSSYTIGAATGTFTTGGSSFSNNPVHVDFGNALDNQSGIITLRIVTLTGTTGSGNRPTSAIDDFKLSWEDPTAKTISLSTTALTFPTTNINATSTRTYTIVSQTNLDQPILLSTTAPYSISTDNVTFVSNLSVAPADAVNKTIYVKFSPTAVGVYNGNVLHTSVGAVSKTVNLSGEAIDPSSRAFNFNSCTVSSIPGSGFLSINVTGTQKWGCSQYGRNSSNGVDVNGFSGGAAQTNDAWLISPALNLNSIVNIPVLSFYSRGEFSGPKIQLFVSTTYDGSSVPNIANWTEITTANFPTPPGSATTAWTLSDNIDLSAYKSAPAVYIAFRYTSSSALNAARWSVDDIAITDQSSLLSVSPSQLSFGEVAVNTNSASQPISFQAIGGTSNFTVTPPAGYQISADNTTFITTGLVVPQATAATGTTLYIRFSPTVKALKIEGNVRVTATGLDKNVVFVTGSSYPKSETFDVAAYNISFFGSNSTNNATPSDIATQVANITTVMQRLNMDVIAIEEMSNDAALAQLVGNLPGYASVVSNRWSYSFDPPDPSFPPQKIGFIYNTSTVTLSTTEPPRVMFEGMYDSARLNLPGHRLTDYPTGTPSSFWGSGRLPYMATFNVTIGCTTRKVRLVVLHAKSGGTADGYIRRQYDVKVLKDSLDAFYASDSVIILGDYNDRIVTSIYTGNPTSYLPFVSNPNYNILTLPLDQAGRTSFPSSNGLIDHITVTNELTSENIVNSTDIEDPRLYIPNYTATTASDHLPVFTRFALVDKVAPVITCPATITVNTAANQCGATVSFTPVATDNCAGVSVTSVPASGTVFAKGNTAVIVTATDAAGNTATCTFNVVVVDAQAPAITCPANVTVGCASSIPAVNIAAVTATDNCPGVVVTHVSDVISAQTCANKYVVTRTYRATDAAGLTTTCAQTITVNDVTAPVIPVIANVTATTTGGACTANVTFTPTATDGCAGAVTITSVPASGSAFPLGTTTVTVTATDVCGNSSTRQFNVIVSDGQLPAISVQPTNKTVCTGSNTSFTVTAANAVNYQWQQYINGTWTNIAGATTATLSLNGVTTAMNTNSYRVNVTGTCNAATSSIATLFVNPLPSITLSSSNPGVLLPTQFTNITATVNPTGGTFAWFKNGVALVPAVSGGTLSNLASDDAGTYKAVYTDPNGCVNTSADIVITAEMANSLFVAPNPNFGQFWVRYYNNTNEQLTLSVFNSNGTRVYQKTVTTTLAYTRIDVNLGTNAPGIYLVELRNAAGSLVGKSRVIVSHR